MVSALKRAVNFNDGITPERLEREFDNLFKRLNKDVLPIATNLTKSPTVTLANPNQPNDGKPNPLDPKNNPALVNAVIYNTQAYYGGRTDLIIKDFDYTIGDGTGRGLTTMNVGDLLMWLIIIIDPLEDGSVFVGVSNFQVNDSKHPLIKNEEINMGMVSSPLYPKFIYYNESDIIQYTMTGTVTSGRGKIVAIIQRSLLAQ